MSDSNQLAYALKTIASRCRHGLTGDIRQDVAIELEALAGTAERALADHDASQRSDGWIRVEERLPEFDVPVWLYQEGRCWIGERSDFPEGWMWTSSYGSQWLEGRIWKSDSEADDEYQPTLWQPLPSVPPAPTGGKQE